MGCTLNIILGEIMNDIIFWTGEIMNNIIFWTAVGASGTVGGTLGVIIGAFIAWWHLRAISKAQGIEVILKLYEFFDNEDNRKNRCIIWRRLYNKPIESLTTNDWSIIEKTASQMDVIGTILKINKADKDVIFERYCEVIIPLWTAMEKQIKYRRNKKGGYGWNNFEWMVKEAKKWNKKNRNNRKYPRFRSDNKNVKLHNAR